MEFTFWNIKILWWEILAVGVVIALLVRHFIRRK
jgi:hypothetical protein